MALGGEDALGTGGGSFLRFRHKACPGVTHESSCYRRSSVVELLIFSVSAGDRAASLALQGPSVDRMAALGFLRTSRLDGQVTRGVQGPSCPWLPEGGSSLWFWLLGGTSSQDASFCFRFSLALMRLLSAGF